MAIKTEEISIPGFGPVPKLDLSTYAVRVLKANLDDPTELVQLEIILTRGIKAEDVVIIDRDKFTFMKEYFMIVTYWEKRAE